MAKDEVVKIDPAQIERMVQRRVADALASNGVSEGVISREVLFMLPTEFVQVYVQIFDQALKESMVGSGLGRQGDQANPVRRVKRTGALRDSGKGKRAPRAVVQVGPGNERRYKDYWVIKDEVAFQVKRNLDRRLRRMAADAARQMLRGSTGKHAREHAESLEMHCDECAADLTTLRDQLGVLLRHCPQCGARVKGLSRWKRDQQSG